MTFIDTNFFLSFLVRDDPEQHKEAVKLFEEGAQGKKELFSSTIVFFEVNWVISSFYEKTKNETIEILKNLLSMRFINFFERKTLESALDLFVAEKISLEDSYNLSFAGENKATSFATFDQKLKKLTNHSSKR